MAQRFTAERVLNAIKYGVTVTWWWIMVKKLSVIKILILKMLKICLSLQIWARCWMYWEISSDEDSEEISAQTEPSQAPKGNRICLMLFFCNYYSNFSRV